MYARKRVRIIRKLNRIRSKFEEIRVSYDVNADAIYNGEISTVAHYSNAEISLMNQYAVLQRELDEMESGI